MAILDLGVNPNQPTINRRLEYSYIRSSTGYTVNYKVSFKRNNNYSGDHTRGKIHYVVYINNDTIEGTQWFEVYNDNTVWNVLCEGSKAYDLSALSTGDFTIGFESVGTETTSPLAYNVGKTTSGAIPVVSYATNAGISSLGINFTKGNDYYSFSGVVGSNGSTLGSDNNNVTGCIVYYTTDNTIPTTSSPLNFTITGKEKTSWTKSISIKNNQTIRAVCYTLAPYGNIKGEEQKQSVYYYSPPSKPNNLNIVWDKSKPTPKANYVFSWDASNDGYNNMVQKYYVEIITNNQIIETETSNTFVSYSGIDLGLTKGGKLRFKVYAQGNSTYNNISETAESSILEIISAGIVKIKLEGTWKEGQVWIKNNGAWYQATEVYIKDKGKWNSSV